MNAITVTLSPSLVSALVEIVETIKAAKKDSQQVQSGLRPGQSVVDVGANADEAQYTGTLNPDTLDYLDWCYFAQTPKLFNGPYSIFDRKPWIGVRATGQLYPSLAGDISGYYAAGSKFAPYL
jgi:hypothetical protein